MVSTTFNIKHKGYYWWNMLVGNVKKVVFNNRKMLIKHCWWWLVYFSITQHNYNGILMYIDGWYIFLFMMMMVSMFHHWPLLILLMVVGWRFIVAILWCYSRHRTGNNGIYNAYDVSPDDVRWPRRVCSPVFKHGWKIPHFVRWFSPRTCHVGDFPATFDDWRLLQFEDQLV